MCTRRRQEKRGDPDFRTSPGPADGDAVSAIESTRPALYAQDGPSAISRRNWSCDPRDVRRPRERHPRSRAAPDFVSTRAQKGSPRSASIHAFALWLRLVARHQSPPFIIQIDQASLSHLLAPFARAFRQSRQHNLLVVAAKHEVEAGPRIRPRDPVLGSKGVGAPVDKVAEAEDPVMLVHLELGERPAKRREVPVDVADHEVPSPAVALEAGGEVRAGRREGACIGTYILDSTGTGGPVAAGVRCL